MVARQKRLQEVYDHLRKYFGIHTKIDFAESIHYSRVYVTNALNGDEKNLTDKLFNNICEAYPDVFNLDYLLNGEGELLANSEQKDGDVTVDPGDYMAKYIASLEKQVKDKDQQIADLRQAIERLTRRLRNETSWDLIQTNLMGGIAADELQEPAKDK